MTDPVFKLADSYLTMTDSVSGMGDRHFKKGDCCLTIAESEILGKGVPRNCHMVVPPPSPTFHTNSVIFQ